MQGRTGTANLGQLDDARRSYQNALDLYERLPARARAAETVRRDVANTLLARSRLEYDAYHEDVAETFARRMLDALGDGAESQTRLLRAVGERNLSDIRLRQGRTAEALGLLRSTTEVLAELQRSGYAAATVPLEMQEAIEISERAVAVDAKDRQARFDLAARYGKLGDAVWSTDPARALLLDDKALATAKTLASSEQIDILHDSYITAISRPLIKLGRTAEARKTLLEALAADKTDEQSQYADRVGELSVQAIWPALLIAEGKRDEARRSLGDVISRFEALRTGHPEDLTLIHYLAGCYRTLAAITSGAERRDTLLKSAAAWHSWPATSFTKREEQADLDAAGR